MASEAANAFSGVAGRSGWSNSWQEQTIPNASSAESSGTVEMRMAVTLPGRRPCVQHVWSAGRTHGASGTGSLGPSRDCRQARVEGPQYGVSPSRVEHPAHPEIEAQVLGGWNL